MRSEHKITEEKIMEGTTTTETTGTQDMCLQRSQVLFMYVGSDIQPSAGLCLCVCVSSHGVILRWLPGRLGLSWRIVPQDQNTLQRIHSMRNISIYRSQWRANMLTSWHTNTHTDTHSAEGSWTCLRLDRKQRWRLLNLSSRTQFQTGSCAARPRFTSSQQ